jgi:hypothetical protein
VGEAKRAILRAVTARPIKMAFDSLAFPIR